MKNSKNKILAAAVCGVIVSSIGASFIIDNNKKESKVDIPQDIENSEIDKTEVNDEEIVITEENMENEIDNETEENIASNEDLSVDTYSSEVNSSSDINSSNENSQNTTSDNTTNNIPSNNTVVEEINDEASNGGESSNITDMVESTSKYKDGTYSGSASGFAGALQVNVQILKDVITSITITSHSDTPGFADRAIEEIPSKIISSQSTSVDVVSGATYTSKGIINAVNDALNKAYNS